MLFLNVLHNAIIRIHKEFTCNPALCRSRLQVNHRLPYSARWSTTLRPSLSTITLHHLPWRRVRQLPKSWSWAQTTTLCQSWGTYCFMWAAIARCLSKSQWQLRVDWYHWKTQTSFLLTFCFSSLNKPFGSGIVTPSGILLNSQILDFTWPNKTKSSSPNPVIVHFVFIDCGFDWFLIERVLVAALSPHGFCLLLL